MCVRIIASSEIRKIEFFTFFEKFRHFKTIIKAITYNQNMSHQNEEEFEVEAYMSDDVVTLKTKAKAKKPKLSSKHESFMVFGFWLVQQLELDSDSKSRAYELLKLKDVDVAAQTEFYSSFTEKCKVHKEELKLFCSVPKVRKQRAPRQVKISPEALELAKLAQGADAPKKSRGRRSKKALDVPVLDDEFQTLKSAEEEVVTPKILKKRGRKAKAKTDVDAELEVCEQPMGETDTTDTTTISEAQAEAKVEVYEQPMGETDTTDTIDTTAVTDAEANVEVYEQSLGEVQNKSKGRKRAAKK